jgi:superfamily II RNA helicase
MTAPAAWPPAEGLALPTSYELDPFQKHAVLGIHAGDHVFVAAKTGSGKTFVGEYLIARALAAGKRVFYTTPIKSLSNQKYHDLKRLFPAASVGILTGDIKMCPDAQIVVMTAEILRNLFYKRGTATEGVGLTATVSLDNVVGIVMDEAHYIMDPDRGHVWEETLILCPRDMQLVLLSATMPSAAALTGWLAQLHERRTWLLETTYRVVPLVHGTLEETSGPEGGLRVRPLLTAGGAWISDGYTGWLQARKATADAAAAFKQKVRGSAGGGGGSAGAYWNRADHDTQREARADGLRAAKVQVLSPIGRLRRLVAWLQETGQMPALFFVFSRKECERFAAQIEGSLIDTSESTEARHIMDFHLSRHRATLEKSPQYHQIRELLLRGVAFHHSGLQPLLKEIVEILFTRGFVRALFATETFSVGLNMPTKTVVFLELEKWSDGGQRRPLRPDEYIQMAGRAGRRGLDKQGLVLYEPLRDTLDSPTLRSMLTGALPALESRMRFGYEFLLRLRLASESGRTLPIAEQSYWAVQQRLSRAAYGADLIKLEARVIALEGAMPAGVEAALMERLALQETIATTTNAKRKKAQLELAKWDVEHRDDVPKGQWILLEERYQELVRMRVERAGLRADLAVWDAAPLLSLEPQEACLQEWGFLAPSEAGSHDLLLTPLGQAATEINEGHCILMPLLAASGVMTDATGEEIATILSTFNREGVREEEQPTLADLDLTPAVTSALTWIRTRAADCQRTATTTVADNYWTTNTVWPGIVAQWLGGAGLAQIAADWDLFEGNVQRGLLKIANLLEEWGAIATLRTDLATLEKLADQLVKLHVNLAASFEQLGFYAGIIVHH